MVKKNEIKPNQTLIGERKPIPEEDVGNLILKALKVSPDFIGQIDADTEEQITFQQMRENSIKCALWLKDIGVKKGDTITICTRNPSIVYVPFLASIYLGAIVNPWEEKYFRDIIRVMYFLVINKPDVIFIDDDNFIKLLSAIITLKKIKKIIKIVIVDKIKSSLKLNCLENILNDDFDKVKIDEFSCEKLCMMDTAIRTFSSTTESYPGQVDIPYIAFVSPSNEQTPLMGPGDIGLWYGSLCWTHGPLLTIQAILKKTRAIKSAVFSEDNMYKTIAKYKVAWVFLESDMCNELLQTKEDFFSKYDISSLDTLLFDNFEIHYFKHEDLVTLLPNVAVIRVYSKPETGVLAFQSDSDVIDFRSAGNVTKNVQLVFVNNELPFITAKKIYCRTQYMTYCAKHGRKLFYYTGDKGLYEADGKIIVFFDSYKWLVKSEFTYYLTIIEAVLRSHPVVSEAIVIAEQHLTSIFHVSMKAYVRTKPEAKVMKKELMEYVDKRVQRDEHQPNSKLDDVLFITYKIPRLPNGKMNREYFKSSLKRSL